MFLSPLYPDRRVLDPPWPLLPRFPAILSMHPGKE